MVHDQPEDGAGTAPPEDGIHVLGMFLEGCKWDPVNRVLGESDKKILYTKCPMVKFMPTKITEINSKDIYLCPLFKTAERKGVLMTTGHSTNYVCDVRLPTAEPAVHWTKRGVAMLCALSQ